jgi:hypothetical protein
MRHDLPRPLRSGLFLLGALCPIVLCGVLSQAQNAAPPAGKTPLAPQQFKNIKILKNVPANQVIPIMRKIDASLGVRCDFCHVINPDHTGFEKDDKPTKEMARKMMVMTQGLNKQKIIGGQASCFMCHHGHPEPETKAPDAPPPPGPGR